MARCLMGHWHERNPDRQAGAAGYRVERIGSAEGFFALEGEWNRLAGNFPSAAVAS